MSHPHIHELAMKIGDIDETQSDRALAAVDVTSDADTVQTPGLRPEVLSDAAQRRTKAMVHAALFEGTGEAPAIGPYQVLRRLGEGGMGVVYAAYDDKLERKVALKLIRGAAMRRPEGRARTIREARALARLSHPHVVHVYQVGEVDDEIFVAMEFLNGPTLRTWLTARPRTWREVLAVFRQAGEGLAAAHRQGVVHRDFKPANVIVGDDGRARVVDFGLAYFGDDDEPMTALPGARELTDVLLTQTGAVLGTPAYMAAEQFSGGRGDAKTDQFSFCAALYEALYGQRPFAGDKLDALASMVVAGRVRPPKTGHDVPAWLHRVVVRGLQPDPAARWPSMDALLLALSPPEVRPRWRTIAAVAGSSLALLLGGLGYAYTMSLAPGPPGPPGPPLLLPPGPPPMDDGVMAARAEVTRTQDAKLLAEARAALTRDPVETIRALAKLAGDGPSMWNEAGFFATAAAVRGLPQQVLRAERTLAEVQPLAGGGFIGRDDLGAVWQWKLPEGTGAQVLAPGAATAVLTARDVPVWAAVGSASVQVFGDDVAQTIDLGASEASYSNWRLASDGRTLVAYASVRTSGRESDITLQWWDLSRPGTSPKAIALPRMTFPAIAADASMVITTATDGIRVIRPREGSETTLKYVGRPFALSNDRRFAVAHPNDDDDGKLDVVDTATGEARRVEADWAMPVGEADVLFTRPEYGHTRLWRESLATGKVVWSMQVPTHSRRIDERFVVDQAGEHFAAAIGDDWGIADLQRGGLRSFVTVPKDRLPRWAGDGALVVTHRNEVRIYQPAASPVKLHRRGPTCGLAPAARWAVATPWDLTNGEYTRVELATGATATFRCPTRPPHDANDEYAAYSVWAHVDDSGQVAVFGKDGWNCWWDEQHGARPGAQPLPGRTVALPRGVARSDGAEVEVWAGPEQRKQRWTAAGTVADVKSSPSGALLAVRSEKGVELLGVDTGAVTPVVMEATPLDRREVTAGALAWSRDSAQLAVLKPIDGSLELTLWDVTAQPREIRKHVLKDSPGRPGNLMAFTPAGTSVALTARPQSLMLVTLEGRAMLQVETPEFAGLTMRSESEAIGLDFKGGPFIVDVMAGEVSPLTPNPDLGASTRPPVVRAEDGAVWACDALGPGTLLGVAAPGGSTPVEVRARVHELAASL